MDGLLLAPAVLLIAGGALWLGDAAPASLVWIAVCIGSATSLVAHWRMSQRDK
jgi:hypothetical protein